MSGSSSSGAAVADVARDLSAPSFDGDDDFDLDLDAGVNELMPTADHAAPRSPKTSTKRSEQSSTSSVILEIGCRIDHPEHLDDPVDPIEIAAQRILNRHNQHEAYLAGMAIPSSIDMPGRSTLGHRTATALRTLAGEIEQVADPFGVDIVAERLPTFGSVMLNSLCRCWMFMAGISQAGCRRQHKGIRDNDFPI